MRRLLLIVPLLLSAVALAGCDPSVTPPPLTPITTGNATADSVISKVVQGCGYKMEYQTAINLVENYTPSGGVFVSLADAITSAVCSALTTKSASRSGVRVSGVAIRGKVVDPVKLKNYSR